MSIWDIGETLSPSSVNPSTPIPVLHAGTHGIMDATFVSHNDTTEVIVNFFAESTARGAVMNCASISASGVVNFTSSVLLTLERINDTATTFIDLYPGEYSVYFYDIEQDGKLSIGEGYSAVTDQLLASGNKQGFNTQNSQNSHPFQEYFTLAGPVEIPQLVFAT